MSDMEIKVCLEEANVNKDFFTPNCKESNHKCPVCQNNLHKINVVVSTCTNDKCSLWGSSIPNLVLEALTQAKQDLEIAIKGIKTLGEYDPYKEHLGIDTIAQNILEQIERKDKR